MLKIICRGRLKEDFYRNAEKEYKKRIAKFCPITIQEVESFETHSCNVTVCLDEHGTEMTSTELADFLKKNILHHKTICFFIGGWNGLTESELNQADIILSLSHLTLPYQLCRVLLLEQVYRAMTIIRGISYHK